jgi:hypothetical protein
MPTFARRYLPLPLLCAALLVTGCAGTQEPSASPTVVTTLGEPTPTPAASPTKASPKASSTSPASVAYPSTARAYAEAVIGAWKGKNQSRLADLTNEQVHEQLIEIPGPPNMSWTYLQCDGAMGSTYCQFTNADGHKLTLRVTNEKLGKVHAITEVKYAV